jgi:hypothetical protein
MTNSPIDFSKLQPVTLIGGGFLRGAHHPHCERYFNHLLWYRGRPFCLGCTCMYTGIVLGFPTALIFQDTYSTLVAWLTLHLLLVAPTIAQPFVQLKCYKIVARLLLGVCITTYFLSGLFLSCLRFLNGYFELRLCQYSWLYTTHSGICGIAAPMILAAIALWVLSRRVIGIFLGYCAKIPMCNSFKQLVSN